jgi:hypothetical protein
VETSSYFSVLQRRWKLVLACLAVGLVAGFMLTPSDPKALGNNWTSNISVVRAPETDKEFPLANVQRVSVAGDVAKQVGAELREDPALLAARVESGTDNEAGVVWFTAKGPTKTAAEALVSAWARTTVKVFAEKQRAQFQASADSL